MHKDAVTVETESLWSRSLWAMWCIIIYLCGMANHLKEYYSGTLIFRHFEFTHGGSNITWAFQGISVFAVCLSHLGFSRQKVPQMHLIGASQRALSGWTVFIASGMSFDYQTVSGPNMSKQLKTCFRRFCAVRQERAIFPNDFSTKIHALSIPPCC